MSSPEAQVHSASTQKHASWNEHISLWREWKTLPTACLPLLKCMTANLCKAMGRLKEQVYKVEILLIPHSPKPSTSQEMVLSINSDTAAAEVHFGFEHVILPFMGLWTVAFKCGCWINE